MALDLDKAANYATCNILTAAGTTMVGTGVATMWAGGSGLVPLGLGTLSLLAAGAACGSTDVGEGSGIPNVNGCQKLTGEELGHLQYKTDQNPNWRDCPSSGEFTKTDVCNEILDVEIKIIEVTDIWVRVSFMARATAGNLQPAQVTWKQISSLNAAARWEFRIRPYTEGSCQQTSEDPIPLPPAARDPITYTDESTNCEYNVTLKGFIQQTPEGSQQPVFLIESKDPALRASGGIVGGCNFSPTIYVPPPGGGGGGTGGGGGGGPITIPWDDQPDPGPGGILSDLVKKAIGGLALGVGSWAAQELLDNLFGEKEGIAQYELVAPCDKDPDGNPEKAVWTVPQQSRMTRLLAWQEAHHAFLQAHLNFKTPTCSGEKPELFLHWRSITFQSDEPTDSGRKRLVKRLRYRGSDPGDLVGLAEYWRDFTWNTGGVIVYHKGSAVGTPQVWAASVDEGKRVLRHAFGEAGVDPDQVGEWGTSSSDNARYGVSELVRLKQIDGCWSATARNGSSGTAPAAIITRDP